MSTWYNNDGLVTRYRSNEATNRTAEVKDFGAYKQLVVKFDSASLPTFTTDRNNDGTNDGFNTGDISVPAGAIVTDAKLYTTTAVTGSTPALNIGFYDESGNALNSGTDLASAKPVTSNAVGDVDSLIDTTADNSAKLVSATLNGYLVVAVASGTLTAGAFTLVISYID